jgi:hypothetical protein
MRGTAANSKWDHARKEDTLTEAKLKPAIDYSKQHQETWSSRMNRMNTGRSPKEILRY